MAPADGARRRRVGFRLLSRLRGHGGLQGPGVVEGRARLRPRRGDRGVGVPQASGASMRESAAFDLAKSPATKRSLLVAAAAVAFWFIDASVSDQMYGREEPWLALGVFTAAMAIALAFAQARSAVPAP